MEQLPEIIYIDGVLYSLYTTPLKPWLQGLDMPPVFDKRAPNCESGYIGRWKIDDDTLWLTGIYAWRDGAYTGLADLFDGREEVLADWFSGPLVVEPASSEIADGAPLKVSTLLVEDGRIVRRQGANPWSGEIRALLSKQSIPGPSEPWTGNPGGYEPWRPFRPPAFVCRIFPLYRLQGIPGRAGIFPVSAKPGRGRVVSVVYR